MPSNSRNALRVCLTLALSLVACLASACARDERPNVILITLDTTRVDHLSCYGYERDTSPSLEALAADGVRYTNAYAVTSWTLPAHASLFTGKFPSSHGAKYDPEGPLRLTQGIRGNPGWDRYRARGLSPEETTLAAVLSDEGYSTCGIVAGPWMKRVFGLNMGFEDYDDAEIDELNGRTAESVTTAAIEWLKDQDGPFFLFLNYYDPHGPYQPPDEYFLRYLPPGKNPKDLPQDEVIRIAYDAEIRYTDHYLGLLLEDLKARGLYENTWIVITADHGELFGENGLRGHGNSLSEAEIHIPLIVKHPGSEPRGTVDETPMQQTDVLPLILEGLGVTAPAGVQGTPPSRARGPLVAEVYPLPMMYKPDQWRQQGDWQVLIEEDFKFFRSSMGNHLLIDLARDPIEATNLRSLDPERSDRMEQKLARFLDALPPPGAAGEGGEVDAETQRALQNLGYVGEDEDE